MGKIGKISVIKREFSNQQDTMESSLARHKNGLTRVPGTGVFKYPYKEIDGKYRTGLDPDAAYIKRILDPLEREVEIERVTSLRKKLEEALGDIDLGPRSTFWNYRLSTSTDDPTHVQPVKLFDGDNFFDFSVPMKELSFAWLRVHPTIASSYQAWERGEYPADTQFYVADDEVENMIIFRKKQAINDAIIKFNSMSNEKKRKVARMLGLPITDDTKDEYVYNAVDSVLKDNEFKSGTYKGLSTIEVFNRFADMGDKFLHIKDLVKQSLTHSIYRMKPDGRIYEGDYEVAKDEDALIKFLTEDIHQEELLMLESKLKSKKIAAL